jgi:DNA-binding SARP family transcriptional activator
VVRGVNLEARPAVTKPARRNPEPVPTEPVREDAEASPAPDSPRWLEHGPFRDSPFGLVLLDGEGQVLSVNDRAAALLCVSERAATRPGLTCCELICDPVTGRGRADTEARCLTRRAVSTGEALPESRFEVRRDGGASTVWVTASPVNMAEARVVVYLRPDDRRARQPRADASAQAPAAQALRIHTLGQTRVEANGRDLGGEWLDQRPGQLLKYLICERHRLVTSDEIGDALWPQAGPLTRNSVRHQVHVLRERLEPQRISRARSRFIVTRRGGYMLDADQVWLDADQFEGEIRAGLNLFAQGSESTAATRLERALALYRGDLMAENLYAEWAFEERDRLRELVGQGLRAMVDLARAAGDLHTAAGHARRLAAMEPFDMDVQRDFIEICLRRGRRSEAMRRYAIVSKRVRREFGQDPDFTLSDLRA